MFQYTFKLEKAARKIRESVAHVLNDGYRTKDILGPNCTLLSTTQMGEKVIDVMSKNYFNG
jgi:3-isopropylmalate dehydrogenase